LLLLTGCGRYFPGPINPVPVTQQEPNMVISDDGSVTYVYQRLEVGLRPMTDDELNRQFQNASMDGPLSTNPYTLGNWKPMGEKWTPSRYSVWLLRVKNYEYPKVGINPQNIELVSAKGYRSYQPLKPLEILEYYYSFIQGYSGNEYRRFNEREDILERTLLKEQVVFSGQEAEGYIVFPNLDPDVLSMSIHVKEVALRFDFRNEPVETTDLTFRFEREVYKGYQPPASLRDEM